MRPGEEATYCRASAGGPDVRRHYRWGQVRRLTNRHAAGTKRVARPAARSLVVSERHDLDTHSLAARGGDPRAMGSRRAARGDQSAVDLSPDDIRRRAIGAARVGP